MKVIIKMIITVILVLAMTVTSYGYTSDIQLEVNSTSYKQNASRAYELYNDLLDYWTDSESDTVIYPDVYGGSYVNDDGHLVILVTEQNYDAFNDAIPISEVIFENVSVSYSKLLTEKDKVVQAMLDPTSDLYGIVTSVGVVSSDSSIVVYVVDDGISAYSSDAEYADSISDIAECDIIVERGNNGLPPQNNYVSTSNYTVNPGSKISVNYSGYSSYRSIAFWAYDSSGNLGVVTAPHSTLQVGMPMTHNGSNFGTCTQAVFSGNVDAAFIKMEYDGFTPSTYIPGHGFSLNGGNVSGELPLNYTVYTVGAKSGPQVGKVTAQSVTTGYGISECVVASNYADYGDSGGLAAVEVNGKYYVAGIITGKTSTNNVGFTKVKPALNTLGLTIYH